MKATPPDTTNAPDASNNANLAAALPEKTAEIEKAGTSFRQALQFESSKDKRQEREIQKNSSKSKTSREMDSGQEIKKNPPPHRTANAQSQNESIYKNTKDKNTKDTSTQSAQEQPTQDQATPPTITERAATNITSQPIAADQATMISSASPAELTAFIEKASQKILLARGDGAQNASLRIELHDDILPQTQLTAQKQPDGSLNLTFTTNNPQSAHLLLQAQNGLAAHMHQTQNFNVNIALNNEQGQPLSQQNASDQNASDQKNKEPEPNWDPVETHLKKL